MEARNFRIGNFVKYKGRIFRIHGISGEELLLDTIAFGVGVVRWCDLNPVELTTRWLIDFGFEKYVIDEDSLYYSIELNDNKFCDLSIVSGCKNGFVEVVLFPYDEWFRFKYVHELQNLFFVLTGRELAANFVWEKSNTIDT